MNFHADTVVQRSCTRDTAGEIRVYRSSFRGIYAPLSFAAHFAALLLLILSRARERAERNPLACKNSTKIPIIVRYDIDSISRGTRTERERVLLEDFRLDFILAKGSSEADSNRFPSFGRCSFSRDGCASLRLGRERERDGGYSWFPRDELEQASRGRGFARKKGLGGNVGGETRFGSTGCCSLGSTWQMGGEDSCRGWRGEKGKGVGKGKKEKHGSGYHDASSRRVRCPRPGRVCARTTL